MLNGEAAQSKGLPACLPETHPEPTHTPPHHTHSPSAGILAGAVSITAGCAFVQAYAAVVIGIVGAFVYTFASKLLHRFVQSIAHWLCESSPCLGLSNLVCWILPYDAGYRSTIRWIPRPSISFAACGACCL
jgi:hypothetical protein